MKVRIIIDSTADLIPAVKERTTVVPLTVHFGMEEYIDGITITHKEFYEKLVETDVLPRTSQAAPAAFAEVFEEVSKAGESAVVLTVSSKLSGTYQSAMIAAADYDNIFVVDSGFRGHRQRYPHPVCPAAGRLRHGCQKHCGKT